MIAACIIAFYILPLHYGDCGSTSSVLSLLLYYIRCVLLRTVVITVAAFLHKHSKNSTGPTHLHAHQKDLARVAGLRILSGSQSDWTDSDWTDLV